MDDLPEMPESCANDNHDFGQAGRCQECGIDRADTYPDERRTGGAGSRTHPLTDREHSRQLRKLEQAGSLE